jgi:hypothetical protein
VFNGSDRLGGKSPEPGATVFESHQHYPEATQVERDHIPIVPPSPTRLLARIGPLSGERLGLELLIGLLLGVPALLLGVWRSRADGPGAPAADAGAQDGARMRRAVAGGLIVWTASGTALFSHMVRLHPRYVESFTPAVAAMLGIGVAWAASGSTDRRSAYVRLYALVGALVVTVYYVERLLYGPSAVWLITLACALGAMALAVGDHLSRSGRTERPSALIVGATIAFTLAAVLALPLRADVTAIEDRVSDAGFVGALPGEEQRLVSAYLLAHQGHARYELAAESATEVGSLIVQDARPIVVLTTYNARVFTPVAKLQRLIAKGEVKYAFMNGICNQYAASVNAACSEPAKWVRAHGTDVSRQAGLQRGGILWRLPGAGA